MATPGDSGSGRPATLWQALIPVAALVVVMSLNVFVFEGDPHLPLVLAAAVAALVGEMNGYRWRDLEEGMVDGIRVGLGAILILLVIGMLIGTWIGSGIVPLLIYYGLNLLDPGYFLVAACLICSVVSVATGSSWTTAGTVGVALVGVGQALGMPMSMVAGAIVSGAYFGDKMSPLSDSTNLAPAVAGSELFEHIRYMLYTTLPAWVLAMGLYAVLGFFHSSGASELESVAVIQGALAERFHLSGWLLLAPLIILVLVMTRVPALPALAAGAALGGLFAIAFQGVSVGGALQLAQGGYVSESGMPQVDELLSRGGLDGMMWTVSLILCALAFGGVMERTGMLFAIADGILKLAHTTGQLVLATVTTCIGMNVVAPDQYLSIIVPGRMYKSAFESRGLHLKNLSRTLEDAGTLTSPLVPWNTCGATMTKFLGVSSLEFLPFAFLNLATPLIAVALGFSGWRIAKAEPVVEKMAEGGGGVE